MGYGCRLTSDRSILADGKNVEPVHRVLSRSEATANLLPLGTFAVQYERNGREGAGKDDEIERHNLAVALYCGELGTRFILGHLS